VQRPDFANDLTRLARGFNRERDLTPERMEALYARFEHLSRDGWRNTVDRCLCLDRYPSLATLEREAENAEQRVGERMNAATDRDAKRVMDGLFVRPELAGDSLFAKLAQEAGRLRGEGWTPPQIACLIAERVADFDGLELVLVRDWLYELSLWGDSWPQEIDRKMLQYANGQHGSCRRLMTESGHVVQIVQAFTRNADGKLIPEARQRYRVENPVQAFEAETDPWGPPETQQANGGKTA